MKPLLPLVNGGAKKKAENAARESRVDFKRTGLAVATIVILSVLLSIHLLPSKVSLKLGDISREDVVAHSRASYVDIAETESRRLQAAQSVRREYDRDSDAAYQADGGVETVFQTIENVRDQYRRVPVAEQVKRVRKQLGTLLGSQVSAETFEELLAMAPDQLSAVRDDSLRLVSSAMAGSVYDDDMQAARERVVEQARKSLGDPHKAGIVGDIAADSLRPNHIFNKKRTVAAQQEARAGVTPQLRAIEPGDLVIANGDAVLREHIQKFEALGLRHPKLDYRSVVSLTFLVVLAVLLVLGYLARYHEDVYFNTKTMMLLALIVVTSVAALKVGGSMLGIKLSPVQVGHFSVLWVVAAAMLLAVLVNPHVSIVITALLSIVLSLTTNNDLNYAATALITALAGVYAVANIRGRSDLMRAFGLLALVGVIMVWVTGGASGEALRQLLVGSVWAIVIAMAATWLFLIGTAFLERPFGRTTHISLLELADTNRPLLRRLVMEAPGTYTHSVAVGHLAETAAEVVGADSLVTRVASYYHDIGKIRRPHFFVENQHIDNVHDRMNPTLSALVITSHIKDGVEIARAAKLPRVVIDIMTQHHGTSLVGYFYNQVGGEHDVSTALEEQFRYEGPKAQTREAAIVMLADSVEAASRCLTKPTPAKIELMVNRVVAEKLRDGQLDQSELTFRQISKIADSFAKTLVGTLHARIDYPEAPAANGRKQVSNAHSDSELPEHKGEISEDEGSGRQVAAS